jgi:signal transduction histidine kinase
MSVDLRRSVALEQGVDPKPAGRSRHFPWRFSGADGDRGQAALPLPRRGLSWPLWGLLAASLAVPLLLLAIAAWQNYRLVQAQADERVMIEANEMHQHALDAFRTYALALGWIDDRIRGVSWQEIEKDPEVHRFLADLEKLPEVDAVWITDPKGQNRASGHLLLPPTDVSDRDYFVAEKQRDVGIFIGRAHVGRHSGKDEFTVARRRSTPRGDFDGIIRVSAKPGYFSDFYGTISRELGYSALLIRSDGTVLAHYPASPPPLVFSRGSRFMRGIAANPDRGVFRAAAEPDRIARIYGYRRVAPYPLYVVFGIPFSGVLASWRANLVDYLVFAVPAALALFCMTWFGVRQLGRHKLASWRWRATAERLRREMGRRELAEAELRQAQKMEALGQLTGGVAHDFNNLLTVLQGCLELLNGRQRDDALQAKVDMALRTTERGERLTRQLLAFARRQPLSIARLDLNVQLGRMAELLAQTVGRGIAIETDLATDLWPLEADATQLELAVINLAINARDAMPDGGVLRLRTFNTTLPGDKTAVTPSGSARGTPAEVREFVGFEVADTGVGMTAEVSARAFEPLFTTKGPGKGTGLGLSMVYGFARQSGGTATIRSEPGRGTAVTLLLPRSRAPHDVAAATGLPVPGPA